MTNEHYPKVNNPIITTDLARFAITVLNRDKNDMLLTISLRTKEQDYTELFESIINEAGGFEHYVLDNEEMIQFNPSAFVHQPMIFVNDSQHPFVIIETSHLSEIQHELRELGIEYCPGCAMMLVEA